VKILADVGERRSSVLDQLEALDVEVELVTLTSGDYVFAGGCVVERKTVPDLHRSIVDGRLWRQVQHLARLDRAYLAVEGWDIDAGPISPVGVRGAILHVIEGGVSVLRSSGPRDTALWLRVLATRASRRSRSTGRRGRRRAVRSPLGLLAAVPGISPELAKELLARFGSIAGIAAAEATQLQEINGIGPRRAAELRSVLLGTFPRSGEVP
jgi:ERCC4-type nuclease